MQFFDLTPYMADMIYELIPGVRKQNGNQLNFRCPLCGDGKKKTSKRGHFYLNEGTYYCWNAGCPAYEKGFSGLQFLSLLTKRPQYEIKAELIKRAGTFQNIIKNNNPEEHNINNLFNDLNEKKKEKENLIKKELLDNNWIDLPKWVEIEINRRKIYKSPYIKKDWKLYYDKKTNRLVIPWTNNYYQLRALTKKQEKESGKYLFPPEIEKPIFGLENIDPTFKYLFLLEGVFDSIFVKNGLAVGSLKLSNLQKEILTKNYSDYTIVYFMDNQYCDQSSHNETLKIIKEQPFINVFIWPEKLKQFKDVNDTIIYSDSFLNLWSNEKFLLNRIFNGIKAKLELFKNKNSRN